MFDRFRKKKDERRRQKERTDSSAPRPRVIPPSLTAAERVTFRIRWEISTRWIGWDL
jgi:hypothetical protein